MAYLFLSTTTTDVEIKELGFTLVHPSIDFAIDSQFEPEEIRDALSLTVAITSGNLVWKKTAGGSAQSPSGYDPDYVLIKVQNSSTGINDDRVATIGDITGGGVTYAAPVALSPDSGNIEGVASTVARSDHKHDLPAAAPTTNLSGATTNAEGTSSSVARSDHTHTINNATTSVAGLMSATDKTKLDALVTKSAIVASGSFAGNPKVYAVTFSTPFASAN
jgi:hypothetical protein